MTGMVHGTGGSEEYFHYFTIHGVVTFIYILNYINIYFVINKYV